MKIPSVSSVLNFKASVKLENEHLYMYRRVEPYLRDLENEIKISPTHNVYEVKPILNNDKLCALMMNGEKIDEDCFLPASIPTLQKLFKAILLNEKKLLAQMKGSELNTKLDLIRNFIKNSGLSIEDAKRYL